MDDTQIVVKVRIADLNIVKAPHLIRTSGLGSCVGVVLYDLSRKVAGLAHVMLPDSNLAKQLNMNEFKYANTAIDYLIKELCTNGARKYALQAKLAGGAQMFQFESSNDLMRIGPRNVQAIQEKLRQYGIPVVAMDVGGNSGRTIDFDPATGNLKIRTVNKGELVI
ncbi:chemotaxis protein CheD [Virgibacillus subterraneus]|uniref:Probable chemoreceptor glutamine deamidase CheD n=2 Tax=Virgibacillus TaxID=84406 RepID=A0A1H1C793_9BACI|nr:MULTISPECIES: chemotaxis protein CheD [Virgibacillus]SDQ60107.1 chemotaxis protein CheD [Virgibacillus salinus]SEQ57561.1 chemotaxis protein CheD [Virgibacillus subterraneus]